MNRQSSSITPVLLRPLVGLICAVVVAFGVLDMVFETALIRTGRSRRR